MWKEVHMYLILFKFDHTWLELVHWLFYLFLVNFIFVLEKGNDKHLKTSYETDNGFGFWKK